MSTSTQLYQMSNSGICAYSRAYWRIRVVRLKLVIVHHFPTYRGLDPASRLHQCTGGARGALVSTVLTVLTVTNTTGAGHFSVVHPTCYSTSALAVPSPTRR